MRIQAMMGALLLAWSTSGSAETFKGGSFGCFSLQAFEEFGEMSARKDKRGMDYLLKDGRVGFFSDKACFISSADLPASVLEGLGMKLRLRVYIGKESTELWTYDVNVKPDPKPKSE